MKPILKYPGAKNRLSDWIINFIPEHDSYLEPFFGSGAVFFNKPKSMIETINDIDGEVINFFKVCREKPEALARMINLTPWAKDEFIQCRNNHPTNDIERARQLAVMHWMSFGAIKASNTFRYTSGANYNKGPDNPKLWGGLPFRIVEAAKRLKNAQIENKPAVDLIKTFNGEKIFMYLDPPYLKETRSLQKDQYEHELSDFQHEELLQEITKTKSKVMISGYDNELYNDYLKDWMKVSKKNQAERGTTRTEVLWMNYKKYEQLTML
jgi:DNA adenine methylase